MFSLRMPRDKSVITLCIVFGLTSATALGTDLSVYRKFQLGANLSTVAKQAGTNSSQAKTIHTRPALIQELEWRPQTLGSSNAEPAKDVVFSFYNGTLFRIVIDYDRYGTEGLTPDDMVEAVSAMYGPAIKPITPAKAVLGRYSEEEEVLAQWQDSNYRFDLIRSSYGPSFKLAGVLKSVEAPALAAVVEAARLDTKEAPEKEAARTAME